MIIPFKCDRGVHCLLIVNRQNTIIDIRCPQKQDSKLAEYECTALQQSIPCYVWNLNHSYEKRK